MAERIQHDVSCNDFTGTAAILDKLEALNDTVRKKSCNFLHQKQAEFDHDYEEFMQYIAEIRVRHMLTSFIRSFVLCRSLEYFRSIGYVCMIVLQWSLASLQRCYSDGFWTSCLFIRDSEHSSE